MKISTIFCLLILGLNMFSKGEIKNPTVKKPEYTKGIVKKAIKGRVTFPGKLISPSMGTIQCWVKLDKEPTGLTYNHLWGIGVNEPGWFSSYINKGKFGVICKTDEGLHNINIDISHWNIDKWHNLAVCWGKYKEKSIILIYEDGLLKIKTEKVSLPLEFNSDRFSLGFNSASYKDKNFAGAIDECAVYSIPLTPAQIRANFIKGKKKRALTVGKNCIILAHFDGNKNFQTGEMETLNKTELNKYLKESLKYPLPRKYIDELKTEYSYDRKMLNDIGNKLLTDTSDKSMVTWRQHPLEIIFELPYTCKLSLVEIVAPKPTIWYRLEKLQISLDKGTGEFSSPETIKTYGEEPSQTEDVTDETCKTYIYKWHKPGKACRVKIIASGQGYMALGEVRICGKPIK